MKFIYWFHLFVFVLFCISLLNDLFLRIKTSGARHARAARGLDVNVDLYLDIRGFLLTETASVYNLLTSSIIIFLSHPLADN